MSDPIVTREYKATNYEWVDKQWTYDELLDLFDDDSNCVAPLARRCMQYEEALDNFAMMIRRMARATSDPELKRQAMHLVSRWWPAYAHNILRDAAAPAKEDE